MEAYLGWESMCEVSDLVLAFNLEQPKVQSAFAWLPLRSYGFKLILQADWVVPSSRESIVETNAPRSP